MRLQSLCSDPRTYVAIRRTGAHASAYASTAATNTTRLVAHGTRAFVRGRALDELCWLESTDSLSRPRRQSELPGAAEEYARQVAAHGEVCRVCGNGPKTRRLHIDHDHKTGAIRGLLCHRCNRFLLQVWVTPAWLRAAADYKEARPDAMTPTEWVDYLARHPELRPTMSAPR